ncbi:sushi, von Willebrand factor type A, EGF and pentraxin domain-containing protein 1-like isoform X3 [Periplaneta americana]|uniref:sushi, von Willebrand factor type A, EGF and pentraxin domain-containing protein 1-like isoform X3 n=1 Tax=Periplaneta americana TaxID=6978 RepID=UPI0037E8D80A
MAHPGNNSVGKLVYTAGLIQVEELRSIDNLYVIMKMVSNLDFTDHIDQDMSILKSQVEKYDVTKALVIWRERRKFRGVLYPTEEGYRIAKDTESEMKKLARTMAESHIKSKKCEAVETDENELHLLSVNSQYERTSFNAAEHEAYRKIDSRLPENKVLKYRVTCIRNGSHSFGSQDAAYHIGGTLQDMFHWIVDLALYDLEVVVNIREATMYYGLALTEESKHHRNIHFFGPTTLRATICYNLLHIAQPKAGDIVVDPMCGGGSIPIEGSLSFKNCYYTCGDVHEKAVNRILLNLEYLQSHRRNYVDAYWWDITCLPLQDSSVDIFITDLPFGKRSGSVFDNRMLYKKALVEMARATRCNTGRAVLLTHDRKSMTMVELVFLVDSSASVGSDNFESELKFVRKLLADFTVSENATRVSVIAYSSPDNVVRHIDYITSPSSENHKCRLLHSELPSIKYTGGGTYTRGALLEAQAVLRHRRSDSKPALFLITDGFSNGGDPLPVARELKEQGVIIFTFGIRNGNTRELYDMASQPGEEYSYILDSFGEFEALVRRALHQDLKAGNYQLLENSTHCNALCNAKSNCCSRLASCSCGTHTGHYSCLCPPGYYGSGLANSCTICPNGTYSLGLVPGDSAVCIPCPDLNHVTYGPATSIRDCHCKKGFVSSGDHCKVITCPKLSAPVKGFFVKKSCGNVLNAACGVRCRVGYQLVGSSIRLCQDDGTWSGQETKCVVKTCPAPKAPKNGAAICSNEDHVIDTECEFSCSPGHTLVGSRHRTCLPLARWDGLHTTCKPIFCSPLAKIANGVYIPADCASSKQVYGTHCNISCTAGYQLKGPKLRICGDVGKWTGRDVNTCVDVTPPKMKCPDNIIVPTDPDEDYATVNWIVPIATDNDGHPPTVWTRPPTHQPMKVKIGTMMIIYIATDATRHKTKCNFTITVEDREPPFVDLCESPPTFLLDSGDNGNLIWDPPLFHDNSGKPVNISRSPDINVFPFGTTAVTYIATDIHGNSATCVLNITVEENICREPMDPLNGHVNCTSNVDSLHCTLTCEEGYAFAVQPRDYFCTYDSDGSVLAPDASIDPFPDCSLTVLPNSLSQDGTVTIEGDSTICEDPAFLSQIERNVREKITQKLAEVCSNALTCHVEDMATLCDQILSSVEEESNTVTRKKRHYSQIEDRNLRNENIPVVNTNHEALYAVESTRAKDSKIELHFHMIGHARNKYNQSVSQVLQSEMHRAKDAIHRSARKGTLLNVGSMPHRKRYLKIKQVEFKSELKFICASGSVLKGGTCIKCPVGTFYNVVTASCESCPIGHYQPAEGSTTCLSCPPGSSTRRIHAKNARECKSLCPPGCYGRKRKHWKSFIPGLMPCTTCDYGRYQPKSGQTECSHCPGNWTTLKRGSTSLHDCKAMCPPGEISQSGLVPCVQCPESYSQPKDGQKFCYSDSGDRDRVGFECLSLPCVNGGTCHTLGPGYFTCDCKPGYVGSYCEIQVKSCDSNPCLHGASCIDIKPLKYNCSCLPGYSGQNCEIEVDECNLNPCLNEATCVDGIDSFSCLCADGFQGSICEEDIDECSFLPCLHNATCIDGVASYSCQCREGYSGRLCEEEPFDPCADELCHNGGTCITSGVNYSCECPPGFEGVHCEVNIDDCVNSPCANSGECIDLVQGYKCLCTTLYTGMHCESQLPSEYFLRFPSSGTTDYVLLKGPRSPLSQVSVCLWLKSADRFNYGTVFSYATNFSDNSFTLTDYNGFVLYVNGERTVTDIMANDGLWHSVCVMWHSSNGDWSIYIDGKLGDNGTGLANGTFIPGGGILILGQEQDLMGSGFSEAESFMGYLSSVAVWDYILQVTEVWDLSMLCGGSAYGNVFMWTDFLEGIRGDLKIENSSFCTDCVPPSAPFQGNVNVSVHSQSGIGSVAIYTCNSGFFLKWGSVEHARVERKCLKQGDWEGPTPFCIRKSCGFPGYFPRGVIQGRSYRYMDKIHYYCNPGYKQLGNPLRVCMANGKWSGEVPICEGKTCEALKHPEHGQVKLLLLDSGDFSWNSSIIPQYGHQVELECDVGFRLEGSNILTCLEDGQWDDDIPTCIPIGCKNPPRIFNGRITHLVTNTSVINSTENWKEFMTSVELQEENENLVIYEFGNKLFYECKPGYIFKNEQKSTKFHVICREDGLWKGKTPDCVPVTCTAPSVVDNGQIRRRYKYGNTSTNSATSNDNSVYIYGSEVEVNCDIGYKLVGPSIRECLESGIWSHTQPHCERVSCDLSSLPLYSKSNKIIENGELTVSGRYYDNFAIFACNNGYKLSVSMLNSSVSLTKLIWTCQLNGTWVLSKTFDTEIHVMDVILRKGHVSCKPLKSTCPDPKEPDNGYILKEESSYNYTLGSIVKFKCRVGYTLHGSDTSICDDNGHWIYDTTTCVPVKCQNPPSPYHTELATVAKEYVYGNMLNYRCKEGYQAFGVMTSRCLATGKWSRVRGKCARVSCGKPSVSNGATILGASYLYQDQVVYSCPPGMKASSHPVITCLSDGTWSGLPTCEKV